MKAIVFYATYGHWTQSLLDAGYDVLGHYQPDVMIDPDSHMQQDRLSNIVLLMNFPNIPIKKDFPEEIDLMVGSPPCIGFSRASPISRLDHPCNEHTLNFAKQVIKIQPKYFLMEMVPEILTKGRLLFDEYIKIVDKDYNVDCAVMEASKFGSAQRRNRLYIWGKRWDQDITIDSPLCNLDERMPKSIGEAIPEELSKYYDHYKPDTRMLMPVERVDGGFRKGPFSLLSTPEKRARRTLTRHNVSFTLVKFSTHNMLYDRRKLKRFFAIPELSRIMGFPVEYRWPNKNVQEVSRMIASGVDIRFATYLLSHIRNMIE